MFEWRILAVVIVFLIIYFILYISVDIKRRKRLRILFVIQIVALPLVFWIYSVVENPEKKLRRTGTLMG